MCSTCEKRRDRFAAAALTGLLARGVMQSAAREATALADVMIAELDKPARP